MFPGVGSPLFTAVSKFDDKNNKAKKSNWILLNRLPGVRVVCDSIAFLTADHFPCSAWPPPLLTPLPQMADKFFKRLIEEQENHFPRKVSIVHVSVVRPITASSLKGNGRRVLRRSLSQSEIMIGSYWMKNNDLNYFYRRGKSSSLVPYPAAWLEIDCPHSSSTLQVQLASIRKWNFDIFLFNRLTNGRPVVALGCKLFEIYGFEEHFHIDRLKLLKALASIEIGYHSANPYHCAVHAADVGQALHCFLQESQIKKLLNPLEKMACILAAFGHDLYHPGVNQKFLERSNHPLCSFYSESVLENFHWRCLKSILMEFELLAFLTPNQWHYFFDIVEFLILATDMQKQQEYLEKFRIFTSKRITGVDMNGKDDRITLMQILIKCADIANPCRTWALSSKWSLRASEEFFNQGDLESRLKYNVIDSFNRRISNIPTVQSGFIDHIARPLFKCWREFIHSNLSVVMLKNLERNSAAWRRMIDDVPPDRSNKELNPKAKKRGSNTLTAFLNKRRVSSSAAMSKRLGRRTSLYDEETRRVTLPVVAAQGSSTLWSAASSYSKTGDVLYQALSIDQGLNAAEPAASTSTSSRVQLNLIPALSSEEEEEEEEQGDAVNQSQQFCLRRPLGPDKGRRASEPIVRYNTSFNGTKRVNNENHLFGAATSARLLGAGCQCRRGSLPMTEKELQVLESVSSADKTRHSSGAGSNHGSFVFRAAVGV